MRAKNNEELAHAWAHQTHEDMTYCIIRFYAPHVNRDNEVVREGLTLEEAQEHMRVLHPLPRVNEIAYDVDKTKHAGYFPQMYNGVIIRQAILLKHLGVKI